MKFFNKFILILVLFLTFPTLTNAFLYLPYARIRIVKQIIGGKDDTFEFRHYRLPSIVTLDKFEITTQNGNGSMDYGIIFVPGPDLIYETYSPNWDIVSIVCSSTNPLNKFEYKETGVALELQDQSDSTCIFTNKAKSLKNPVLIIPGVLGTELFKNEEELWANPKMAIPENSDDFMDPLAFKKELLPTDTLVKTKEIIKKRPLFDYSNGLINDFTSQGYTEGTTSEATLFTFPYDWRFGVNRGNSVALKLKIDSILAQTGASKVDVVAHSTGGLLVKRYVSEYPDSHNIGKAVFVGVPNTGAPKAVKVLLQGDNFGVTGLSDEEMKKISQNMPVVYDLLPSVRYYNNKGSYYKLIEKNSTGYGYTEKDLNFTETNNELKNRLSLNSQAIDNSSELHNLNFDNLDLRVSNIDLYNIAGCKNMDTIGKIVATKITSESGSPINFESKTTPGDGTVPLESATNLPVDSEKKFYALKDRKSVV